MKWVSFVQTSDGKLHKDCIVAKRYANRRYTDASFQFAEKLFNLIHGNAKISDIDDFINENLSEFVNLSKLKADIELEKDENE